MSLLRDVRKSALAAAILGALAYALPLYRMLQAPPAQWGLALVAVLSQYVSAAFYFALWRHPEPLRLTLRLRRLCLIAAVFQALIVSASIPGWFTMLGRYRELAKAYGMSFDANMLTLIVQGALVLSSVAYFVMLVSLSAAGDADAAPNAEFSAALEVVSRAAVVLGGLWLIFGIVMTALFPKQIFDAHLLTITTSQQEQLALSVLMRPIRGMVTAACIFVAPYVVAMSARSRPAEPTAPPTQTDPPPEQLT
jgi:hypothetical protein